MVNGGTTGSAGVLDDNNHRPDITLSARAVHDFIVQDVTRYPDQSIEIAESFHKVWPAAIGCDRVSSVAQVDGTVGTSTIV
jgi:hypothetical protein